MNRLNKAGIDLLEYKKEYLKDYPELIINSLSISLDQLVGADICDRTAVDLIKNKDISVSNFEKYLLESDKYSKTEEELRKEMEDELDKFVGKLKKSGIDDFETNVSVEKELFFFTKKINISVDFIRDYFGLAEKELSKIMEPKGFAEKFVILRAAKVMNDTIEQLNIDGISGLTKSATYFNIDGNGFDIDLIKQIDMSRLLKDQDLYIKELEQISEKSSSEFNKKMKL